MSKTMMRYLFAIVILLFSCSEKKNALTHKKAETTTENVVVEPEFQSIIDSAKVAGSILIYDLQKDVYHSNNFEWVHKGNLPASTFKIANSIVALETKVIKDDSTLFKWDGQKRAMKNWEQDLILKDAFHYSCVPCYQEVAREIGVIRMTKYLKKFNYGNMAVDSTNVDMFWLEGDSRISQHQQIDFLKRFYQSELPISQRTEKIMKRMIVMEESELFKLSGKTGWSVEGEKNNGWFVGYIESDGKVFFFATNVEPREEFNMELFPMIRKEVTFRALKQMGIIIQRYL